MSGKRRDSKNRILRNGESQRRDGRYAFKYIDTTGKPQFVYSWKLEKTDKTPQGKRDDLSLREKEKQIMKAIDDEIVPRGGEMTVLELVKKYLLQKTGVRHNTEANYNFVLNIIKKEDFGKKRIDKVKLSDAKCWLIKLQQDGRGYSSIHSIRGVVRPAFQMAVDDDLIRKNPFEFQLATVVVNDSVTREAITRKQERAFLEFVANDKHFCRYYEGIFILFKTGLRISEFVGLTLSDLDMQNRKISVNHQLQRKRNMEYVIEDTKTSCGTREIPMTDEVYKCFQRIISSRKKPRVEPIVGGKCGFLYLDKNDMPMVALHWEKYFQHICEKYNSIYRVQMPKVTPHVCRHTFCSNMAKSGMNPKTLQYLMGHSDIILKELVHHKIGDIALVVYYLAGEKEGYVLSAKIKKSFVEKWGKDADTVFEAALINTYFISPPRIYHWEKMLFDKTYEGDNFMDILGTYHPNKGIAGNCLSTEKRTNGAAAIFLPGVARRLSELLGSDLYLVFTSVHEVMVHNADVVYPEDLKEVLSDTLEKATPEEDYLTSSIYRYSRRSGEFSVELK